MNDPFVLDLWPIAPSDSAGREGIAFPNPDVENRRFLRNVTVPTLTAFLPDASISTGTGMIVCPGGGCMTLAIDYEGLDIARWLCQRGIAAFVLKYRLLPTPPDPDEALAYFRSMLGDMPRLMELVRPRYYLLLADGKRALSIVRQRAREWDIRPDRIGMMGFSAGALVTMLTTLQGNTRPNFAASIYGALWENLAMYSPLPPLFIALADNDELSVEPSLQLYSAWHKANTPVEMHIYASGGHGFAMRDKNPAAEAWIKRLYEWMQVQGFIKP
jgi:acetyl esterase/lipase